MFRGLTWFCGVMGKGHEQWLEVMVLDRSNPIDHAMEGVQTKRSLWGSPTPPGEETDELWECGPLCYVYKKEAIEPRREHSSCILIRRVQGCSLLSWVFSWLICLVDLLIFLFVPGSNFDHSWTCYYIIKCDKTTVLKVLLISHKVTEH